MLSRIYTLVVDQRTGSGWRLPALDGLRGIAAMMVLVAHVRAAFAGDDESLWWAPVERGGHGGVVLFFALSGFLLYLPWLRSDLEGSPAPRLKTYVVRRCLRIMPAYYASVIAILALRVLLGGRDPISIQAAALHFVFLPTLMTPVLTVYWTLQVEEFFYWLLPAMHRVIKAFGSLRLFAVTCAVSLCWAIVGTRVVPFSRLGDWLQQTPFYLPAFVLGIITAQRWQAGGAVDHARRLVIAGLAFYVAISPLALYVSHATDDQWTSVMDLALAPAMSAVVLGVARGGAPWLAHPVLRFLGAISFSLYLWHMPVIRLVPVPEIIGRSFGLRLTYSAVIAIAVALISYLCIERPFLRMRPLDRRRDQPDATRTA